MVSQYLSIILMVQESVCNNSKQLAILIYSSKTNLKLYLSGVGVTNRELPYSYNKIIVPLNTIFFSYCYPSYQKIIEVYHMALILTMRTIKIPTDRISGLVWSVDR